MKYFHSNGKKPSVKVHKHFNDCIVISPMDKTLLDISPKTKEVIVDISTGQSVLRGSHVFAPGVMAMTFGKIIYFYFIFVLFNNTG